MIEVPPLLQVRRDFPRPSAELLAAFAGAPTGMVADAMGGAGALDPSIKPLAAGPVSTLVGPALPVDCGPGDILALLAAPKFLHPGDVVVVAFGGHRGCAALGDRASGMLKNAGAAAVITDGPARDAVGIEAVGLPIWCAGLSPNSPFGSGPGSLGLPIQLGGRQVGPGDIVVADRDGVVIVPLERAEATAKALARVRQLEAELDARVAAGLTVAPDIEELLASPRVAYVD